MYRCVRVLLFAVLALVWSGVQGAQAQSMESFGSLHPFPIYSDANSPDNHYQATGWMGDIDDIKMHTASGEACSSGSTCLKITYTAEGSYGANFAGIYWQNPANNWGNVQYGGFDLTGATKLVFWARGEVGGEVLDHVGVGFKSGRYPDSARVFKGPIVLSATWERYEIDLEGHDLSKISSGFMLSIMQQQNTEGFVIYLDDIRFE